MTSTVLDPSTGGASGRSTRGQVPLYSPRIKGDLVDFSATNIDGTMAEGQHDSFTINAVSSTLTTTDGMLNSPISFYFGVPPRTELVSGYIMEITDENLAQGQLSFTLSILGVTKSTFSGKPRFWRRKPVTSAISDLAANSGLGYGGHTHSYLWGALAQTDESDWTMINAFASRVGWVVFNRYGVVLCYDPVRLFREKGTYTRIVSGLDDPLDTDRMLLDFQVTTLSSIAKDNLGRLYGYFTSGDEVQTSKQTGEFSGYTLESRVTVRDQAEAAIYDQAAGTRISSWAEAAVARIWGDADIYPGMAVEVVTASKRWYAPKTDGRWLVRGTGHQADRQQFQTILFLTRPNVAALANTPIETGQTFTPFWLEPNPPRSRPVLSLNEGLWVSSWANQQLRGTL